MNNAENNNKHRSHSASHKIWNVLTGILVCMAIVLTLLLVGVRIIGLQPFCVLSGSMEPEYHVGSLIYVKKTEPEEIKVGDPITFVLNEELTVATHRVIEIDSENQRFYTKGDANENPDSKPVHFKNLIGRPVFSIPYLGYVSNYLSHPPGMYVAICGAILLILLMFIPDIFKKKDDSQKRIQEK